MDYSSTNQRRHSWTLLSMLNSDHKKPWHVIGDFNEIITHDENREGRPRPKKQMEDFR